MKSSDSCQGFSKPHAEGEDMAMKKYRIKISPQQRYEVKMLVNMLNKCKRPLNQANQSLANGSLDNKIQNPEDCLKKLSKQMNNAEILPGRHKNYVFSSIISSRILQFSKENKYFLNTVCLCFMLFENYCMFKLNHQPQFRQFQHEGELLEWATACLQIAVDVSQNKYHKKVNAKQIQTKRLGWDIRQARPEGQGYKRTMQEYKKQKLKAQILKQLKWKVNYFTFINISDIIFKWIEKWIHQHNQLLCNRAQKYIKMDQLHQAIISETQIIIQQLHFLTKDPIQCADILIERVLSNFGLATNKLAKISGQNQFKADYFEHIDIEIIKYVDQINEQGRSIISKQGQSAGKESNLKPLFSNIKALKQLKQSNKQLRALRAIKINPLAAKNNEQQKNAKELNWVSEAFSMSNKQYDIFTGFQQNRQEKSWKEGCHIFPRNKTKFHNFRQMVLKKKINKYFEPISLFANGQNHVKDSKLNQVEQQKDLVFMIQAKNCTIHTTCMSSGVSTRNSSFD